MRNDQFAIDCVAQTVLLHSRIKVNLNSVGLVLLKRQLLYGAAERLIDLEVDSGGQRTHVPNRKLFGLGCSGDTLLPHVLEVELWHVELQNGSDEVTEDVRVYDWLGLAVITDDSLALPGLRHLADLGRIRAELDHDTVLRVQDYSIRDNGEHKFLLFLFLFLAFRRS